MSISIQEISHEQIHATDGYSTSLLSKRSARTYPKLRAIWICGFESGEPESLTLRIVGQLDKLLYQHDGTALREVLLRHSEKLRDQYKIIQENIAD